MCQGVILIHGDCFLEVLLRLRQRITAHLVKALPPEAVVLERVQRSSAGRQDPSLAHWAAANLERLFQHRNYPVLHVEQILPGAIDSFRSDGVPERAPAEALSDSPTDFRAPSISAALGYLSSGSRAMLRSMTSASWSDIESLIPRTTTGPP
jgi:hypothetical protein